MCSYPSPLLKHFSFCTFWYGLQGLQQHCYYRFSRTDKNPGHRTRLHYMYRDKANDRPLSETASDLLPSTGAELS